MNLTRQSRRIMPILALIIIVAYATTPALGKDLKAGVIELNENSKQSHSIRFNQQITTTVTIFVNLPIIEQNALTETPVPPIDDSLAGLEAGTPTPTPIPIQTGSVNLPIVVGALAIIFVIILAWFFIGYLPARKKG